MSDQFSKDQRDFWGFVRHLDVGERKIWIGGLPLLGHTARNSVIYRKPFHHAGFRDGGIPSDQIWRPQVSQSHRPIGIDRQPDRLYPTTIPNLQNRLVEIVNVLSLGFKKERVIQFAMECAQLRNDLAHGGHQDRTIPYSDFISSVQKKNNALSALYHASLLLEIGLDPGVVRSWVIDSPPAFRRRWAFAEAGLIEHGDVDSRLQK
jgi:hypothetical protein